MSTDLLRSVPGAETSRITRIFKVVKKRQKNEFMNILHPDSADVFHNMKYLLYIPENIKHAEFPHIESIYIASGSTVLW